MPLISVIVPVYNVEKDVRRCIKSILAQDFTDFELLLVNDGSTDSSGDICYSFKDERIRYFTKPNGGLASARNYGLVRATGEYIYCVDSDDYIEPDCLSFCLEKQRQTDADIVLCGYFMDNGKGRSEIVAEEGVFSGDEINDRMIELKSKNLIDPAWNKLYRRSFLKENDMWFPQGEIYEDTDFNLRLLQYQPKIAISKRCFYHYVLHMGSITRRFNPEKLGTIKRRAKLLKSVTKGIDAYCDYYYIKSVFSSVIDMFMSFNKTDIKKAIATEIKDKYFISAAENALAPGRNARLVTAVARSGSVNQVYLFCKASYILKFRMQKLFLRVRQ